MLKSGEELDLIKLSRFLIVAGSLDEKNVIVFDPKNLGILDTYEVASFYLHPKSLISIRMTSLCSVAH
jgi:hypothetical protein